MYNRYENELKNLNYFCFNIKASDKPFIIHIHTSKELTNNKTVARKRNNSRILIINF